MKEETHTLGRSPARHLAGQLDTNDLRSLQLPRQVGHDIDSISTTDTNGAHAETAGVGGVRVGADQQTTGEGVVLEQDLVNDTRAGLPETNVVLCAGGRQEFVDLLVDADGAGQVLLAADLGLDQVVAVHGGGVGNLGHACGHELQDGHLGGGVLARDAVGTQLQVGGTALNILALWVVQVGVEDLLGVGEGAVESCAHDGKVLGHLLVVDEVALLPVVLLDLFSLHVNI